MTEFKSLCDIPDKAWETNCIESVYQIVTAEYAGTKKEYKLIRDPTTGDVDDVIHCSTQIIYPPLTLPDKVVQDNMMNHPLYGLNVNQILFDMDEGSVRHVTLPRSILHEMDDLVLFPDSYWVDYTLLENVVVFYDDY